MLNFCLPLVLYLTPSSTPEGRAVVVAAGLPHTRNCQEFVEIQRGFGRLGLRLRLGRRAGGEVIFYRLHKDLPTTSKETRQARRIIIRL